MATQTTPSAAVQAKAARLLEDRHRWRWVRNQATGVAFVAVPSPCCDRHCPRGPEPHDHIRQVRPDGRGCSCPASQKWNAAMCAHRLAVQMANAEDDRAAAPKPRPTYAVLYPSCWTKGCQNDPEPDSGGCYLHSLVDAF